MKRYLYNIHLEPEPDGRFCVTIPALGCATCGDNYEHALRMAQECIECHLDGLRTVGLPVPEEPELLPFDTAVEVVVPSAI